MRQRYPQYVVAVKELVSIPRVARIQLFRMPPGVASPLYQVLPYFKREKEPSVMIVAMVKYSPTTINQPLKCRLEEELECSVFKLQLRSFVSTLYW